MQGDSANMVSADDVIESYKSQLSDAAHRIALLEAQITRMGRIMETREREARIIREDGSDA